MNKIGKAGAVLGALGYLGAGLLGVGAGFLLDSDPQVDLSNFVTQEDLTNATADLATSDQVASLQADIVWEGTAEGLALVELQEDQYEGLRDFLNLSRSDWEDLDYSVEVRDVDVEEADANDLDATVDFELRVRHENDSGHSVRQTITAVATIENGEVENLDFA